MPPAVTCEYTHLDGQRHIRRISSRVLIPWNKTLRRPCATLTFPARSDKMAAKTLYSSRTSLPRASYNCFYMLKLNRIYIQIREHVKRQNSKSSNFAWYIKLRCCYNHSWYTVEYSCLNSTWGLVWRKNDAVNLSWDTYEYTNQSTRMPLEVI
jgi:hypothetical protein